MDTSQKLKTGSRTPRCQGLDQSQLMSMVYGGTTKNIRQMGTNEILKSISNENQSSGRMSSRAPAYKTPEEYYDEVLSLKKNIQELNSENSLLKLKVRRMEEEVIKKHKHVEQLLDPSKDDDIRRTLTSASKQDSNLVVTSQKQKIFKLEQKLRDKETELQQLQSSIKTTKIDEFNIMLETLYGEIVRLKSATNEATNLRTNRSANSNTGQSKKISELKATIMKVSTEKNQLLTSNRSLKEDMQKCIETQEILKKELDIILKKEKRTD